MKKTVITAIIVELILCAIAYALVTSIFPSQDLSVNLSFLYLPILLSVADSIIFREFKWQKLIIALGAFLSFSIAAVGQKTVFWLPVFIIVYGVTTVMLVPIKRTLRTYRKSKHRRDLFCVLALILALIIAIVLCDLVLRLCDAFGSSGANSIYKIPQQPCTTSIAQTDIISEQNAANTAL